MKCDDSNDLILFITYYLLIKPTGLPVGFYKEHNMRNIFLYLLIITILFFTQSCNRTKLGLETYDINYKNQTNGIVSGNLVDLDVMGVDNVYVFDTLMLVTTTNPDGMLTVFNTNSKKLLANLCNRGRAKNEFLRPTCYSKQLYLKNGDLIIPLRDDAPILREVNVSQSIIKQATVIDDRIDCIRNTHGRFLLIDNDIHNQFVNLDAQLSPVKKGEVLPPKYYISKDDKEKEIKVFPHIMKFEDESDAEFYYYGEIYKHPSKNIVVQPMLKMDYILFFDLDNEHYYAIHQEGSRMYDDEKVSRLTDMQCFQGCDITDDFILLLYFGGDYSVNTPDYSNAAPELLFFDWDGNYITGIKLNVRVKDIAYDAKNRVLYGLNRLKDEIYSFDLSGVMEHLQE